MHSRLILISVTTALMNFACTSASKNTTNTNATKDQITSSLMKANKMECAQGHDIRWLELRGKDRGCELSYTKHGQAAIVSTAHHGTGYCKNTLTRIKGNLENAGYTCK